MQINQNNNLDQTLQKDIQQNQIKRRILKLNLIQYFERYKHIFISLSYFIILSIIDAYFISYSRSINKILVVKNLQIDQIIFKTNQTLFNTIETNTILLNNLYKCLYVNIICIFCSLGISIFDFFSIDTNTKQSNGIKTNKKETLQYFLIFVNFVIKGILSFQIIHFITGEKINNKLRPPIEVFIEISYIMNFMFGILFMVLCCAPILCVFFEFIWNIFINFAKKITINVEETYIDTSDKIV